MNTANKIPILPLRRPGLTHQRNSDGASHHSTPESDGIDKTTTGKKQRASKPKVRTGCLTCKIRRVKCDETAPSCNRCLSTGRKCDGYTIPPRKQRCDVVVATKQAVSSPERCLEVVPGTAAELRALEFFHNRTAPGLSSYFDAEFWTRLVFQVSMAEPAIRHAMVAVGSLHQQRELEAWPMSMVRKSVMQDPLALSVPVTSYAANRNDPFALTQYNKAIAHLTGRLQDPVVGTDIALLACILFVCIEFVRGDVDPAIKHFKSGMSIAVASLTKHDGSRTAVATMQRVKENVLPFFNRLELLSTLFGNDAGWAYPVDLEHTVPAAFTSIKEARDSIVHLMNLTLRFIRSMKSRKYNHLVRTSDLARKEALQHHIKAWQTALDALLNTSTTALSTKDLDASKVLHIHQLVMLLWLSASTHPTEICNDAHMAEFETAVILGEALQAHAGTREQRASYPTTFLFDMEIVSPLYYIAIKCRHPVIRRRAIALLRQTVRREGLWDSNMAAAIASHITRIEEAHLTAFDGSELPAETDRVHNSHIQSTISPSVPNGGGGGVLDAYRTHSVTFYSKPYGVDGAWKIWQEDIELTETSNYARTRELVTPSGEAVVLLGTGHGRIAPSYSCHSVEG